MSRDPTTPFKLVCPHCAGRLRIEGKPTDDPYQYRINHQCQNIGCSWAGTGVLVMDKPKKKEG